LLRIANLEHFALCPHIPFFPRANYSVVVPFVLLIGFIFHDRAAVGRWLPQLAGCIVAVGGPMIHHC
jgi:hypothetical protein